MLTAGIFSSFFYPLLGGSGDTIAADPLPVNVSHLAASARS